MKNPDMSFLKNMPIYIIHKSTSGDITQGFTIDFNEYGYPVKSTSTTTIIEASYQCN